MKLTIGENIKFFRKSKDITQEELAEMLGISSQSVSRWESGVCYPDMELLPVLAEIFEVTIDKLLGVDDISEKKKVKEYLDRFQIAISKGQIEDCITIAREGVAEYPNNYELLDKLMYALFVSGDETGNISNWNENMEKYDAEITAIGERIMKHCPDSTIRYEATARLAFNHCEHGRKEIGRKIYETLPSMSCCRESCMWWSLEDDEKLDFTRKTIKESYDILENYIWILAKHLPTEETISVYKKILEFQNLITDGKSYNIDSWGDANIHQSLAESYARLGMESNVYEELEIAVKKAIEFDNRPDTQKYSSLLLGTVTVHKTDFECADTRPLTEIMRDKWLTNDVFDHIRHTEEFQKILNKL